MVLVAEWHGGDIDIVVIGAGAAGVAAGRRLQARWPELSLLVLEAGDRVGGRAWSVSLDGELVDLGCGWLHGAQANMWTKVAEQLGFAIDRTPAPWNAGRHLLGLSKKDRDAAAEAVEQFFARAESHPETEPDLPLAALLDPRGSWNNRLDAIGTFINGVELREASVVDYNRYDPGPPPDWRVRNGYGTLISAFATPLPVALNTTVTVIDLAAPDAIRIETDRGALRARRAILSVSSNMLARAAIRFNPPLPHKTEAASHLPLGLANKLFLRLARPEEFPTDARLLGARNATRTAGYQIRPFGTALVEAYFGGALAHDLEREGMNAATHFAIEELSRHFGSNMRDRLVSLAFSGWAGAPHIGGSYSYAQPGHSGARAILAEPVQERLYYAGEACSIKRFSTAHGAYETGVAAADAAGHSLRAETSI